MPAAACDVSYSEFRCQNSIVQYRTVRGIFILISIAALFRYFRCFVSEFGQTCEKYMKYLFVEVKVT